MGWGGTREAKAPKGEDKEAKQAEPCKKISDEGVKRPMVRADRKVDSELVALCGEGVHAAEEAAFGVVSCGVSVVNDAQ